MLKRADAIPGARVKVLASKKPPSEGDLLPNEMIYFEKGPGNQLGDMMDQLTKRSVAPIGQILILTSKPRRTAEFAARFVTFK